MNLFYLTKSITVKDFQQASLLASGNKLFLYGAYPNYPLVKMVEVGGDSVDIAILNNAGDCGLIKLTNPLNEVKADFGKRSVIAETMLWANAYLRSSAPLVSAFEHWRDNHLYSMQTRNGARHRRFNCYLFEYCYRLMAKCDGLPGIQVPPEGYVLDFIKANLDKTAEETYLDLNKAAGFIGNPSQWQGDVIYMAAKGNLK